jgi:galactose mutarotase-like enzyme
VSDTPPGPPESLRARLVSDELEVTVLPAKGADVYSIIDTATGIDVLFKPPWGWRDPASLPTSGLAESGWLDRYVGGWQLLLPNAGRPRTVAGALRGYHGEASVAAWAVQSQTATRLEVSTHLTSAPLHIRRTFILSGTTLTIDTVLTNDSTLDVPVMWVEHPVFGAAFIDEHSQLTCDARTFLSDKDDPGTLLSAGVLSPPAQARAAAGGSLDLHALPSHDESRKVFGALTGFTAGSYEISSPTAGFGIRLQWDREQFPHAWLWQECHATMAFPWFGRAYAVAVEPANVLPGDGESAGLRRADSPVLAGGTSIATSIAFSTFRLPKA